MSKRVVITGIGNISSIGNNVEEMVSSLEQGINLYDYIPNERFSTEHKLFRNNRGFMIDINMFNKAKEKDISVLYPIACQCISEALSKAKLNTHNLKQYKTGLCLGTSVGACYAMMERIKNQVKFNKDGFELTKYTTPIMIGKIAKYYNINGTVSAISTACASGTNSIGRGFDLIKNEKEDIVICGGIDLFTELTYTGFNSLFALSKNKCRPFAIQRDGMSLGDACCIFILESYDTAISRGAKIYGEVKGYHILNEAYHPTAPHPEGKYAAICMEKALKDSHMDINQIDYINAHGTGTEKNDEAEFKGLEILLRDKSTPIYMNSSKGFIGHTLGAAGSIESLIGLLSLENQIIYGENCNYEHLASKKIKFINTIKKNISINAFISNSFGFGGNMASVVIAKLLK